MTSREAEKLILKHGWVFQPKKGKGSHRVYFKDGHERIILPWRSGGRDLKPYMKSQIKTKLGLKQPPNKTMITRAEKEDAILLVEEVAEPV